MLSVFGFGVVNGVEYGWVGGEDDAGVSVVFVGAEVAQGHVREVVFEVVFCLADEGSAVCEKEDVCDPFSAAEDVGEAGCGSCFAGAGCHDEQVFSNSELDLFTDCADGFFLVVSVCDFVVDGDVDEVEPFGAAVHEFLEVVFAEDAADFSLGSALVVPEVGFKAVGGEDHRASAEFLF